MTFRGYHQHPAYLISIHTALAGCDYIQPFMQGIQMISIHTALAGCDGNRNRGRQKVEISIHTALAGCDSGDMVTFRKRYGFQSTQPSQAVTLTL